MTQTKAELLQTRHQGDIRLGDADSTHYVGFKAPATVGTSLVWTLPAVDGTANYLLKTDGSGNLGWVADSSTDSTKMPLAGGIFTGDVTFDGATAGRDIVFDRSDNALEFADNAKATFGDEADLLIYHQGSSSYIEENGSGSLKITTNGTGVDIQKGSTETIAKFIADGAVELYHDNVKKFNTSAEGVVITGVTATDPSAVIYHSDADVEGEWLRLGRTDLGTIRYHSLKAKHGGGASSNEISFWLHDASTTTSQTQVLTLSGNAKTTLGGAIFGPVKTVSALELDLSTGNYFIKTISRNSTFTFANPAASGTVTAFTLELTHSSGTVTWPSSVKWNADTAPTLTTGKTHLFMFVTDDGGSRYRGSALVDYVN